MNILDIFSPCWSLLAITVTHTRTSGPLVKVNSDRVNLVAPASPSECLLYIPNVLGDTV